MDDVIICICHHLDDEHKISFLSTCVGMHKIKNMVFYTKKMHGLFIEYLSYFDQFCNIICYSKFPKFVTHLQIDWTSTMPCYDIPSTVTHLRFGYQFNLDIVDRIPSSVRFLSIGPPFDKSIKHLPTSVTYLTINTLHSEPVSTIPSSITHLTLGPDFNQSIKNRIPPSVTHLTFGRSFNQQIKNYIPNSVTHLIFGDKFDQQLHDCIPRSVTHLQIGAAFNNIVTDCIPLSVTHLTLGGLFNKSIKYLIPSTVTHITFNKYFRGNIKHLPTTVTHLIFREIYGVIIPSSVIHVTYYYRSKKVRFDVNLHEYILSRLSPNTNYVVYNAHDRVIAQNRNLYL
uniref:F-box and FNIP repeat-containing protein n=1 Tax=viral metagenome TaxID=1070528 RepID=A0A6C0CAA4_9ZZZZ